MVGDVLGEQPTVGFGNGGGKEPAGQGRACPAQPAALCDTSHRQEPTCMRPDWAHCRAGWCGQCGGNPGTPLPDISRRSAFVCGRDLKETPHPGDHSDEALPALL